MCPTVEDKCCWKPVFMLALKGLCHGCAVHFVNNAIDVAMQLKKLLVNDKITASCQTDTSANHYFKFYKQLKSRN